MSTLQNQAPQKDAQRLLKKAWSPYLLGPDLKPPEVNAKTPIDIRGLWIRRPLSPVGILAASPSSDAKFQVFFYSRFLKTHGEILHDKSSKLEQLESEEQEGLDFKEDTLEVSP